MNDIDAEELLKEISSDLPCGEDLEYDAGFMQLLQDIKPPETGVLESDEPSDPPNWSRVRDAALDLLTRTRDLRLVKVLAQACVNTKDLAGFEQSLKLMAGLIETRWETVHPQLDPDDDNDPTLRINIVESLSDYETIIQPINLVPLLDEKPFGSFSLRSIHIATGKMVPVDDDTQVDFSEIETAFRNCDQDPLKDKINDVVECLRYLNDIGSSISERVGAENAPSLQKLTNVLQEIHKFILKQSGDDAFENLDDADSDADSNDSGESNTAAQVGAIKNSQDVIRVLNQICDYYKRNEPSSPIPILLNRAKGLVSKDFMDIVKDLAPDGISQIEVFKGVENE